MIKLFKPLLIVLAIFGIPLALFISIFVLILDQHEKHPDRLSCSAFKHNIEKAIYSREFKNDFHQDVAKICSCFNVNNPSGNKLQYVTERSLAVCAKPYIDKWIEPYVDKGWNEHRQECVHNNIYNELVIRIIDNQKRAHSPGIIRIERNPFVINFKKIYKNCSKFKS